MDITKFKKVVFVVSILTLIGMVGVAYAASGHKRPADIVSELTGRSVEELYEERDSGKTFGQIADEAGKLDEFRSEMLVEKKAVLDERVQEGRISQERADTIYDAMKENQINCDGTGRHAGWDGNTTGQGFGHRHGNGHGLGMGMGMRRGHGAGYGIGHGRGRK
ncbi:MAG TPA: hypothetical protein VFD89_03585 [Clostridia bacterium]|nr:hypothetical protein [Clostridia bacterium]